MAETREQGIQAESRMILRIEPLDTLFFRDGRPFGEGARAVSGLPRPQTFAGALRTAMLREAEVDIKAVGRLVRSGMTFKDAAAATGGLGAAIGSTRFRGPWFAKGSDMFFRAPSTLRTVRGSRSPEIVRLDPLKERLPGWNAPEPGMFPLWRKGRVRLEPVSGYIGSDAMQKFLGGGVPDSILAPEELFGFDDRTGIGVDPDRGVADDHEIYARRLLALRPGVCFLVELAGPREALNLFPEEGTLVALGGESRQAVVRPDLGHSGPPRSANAVSTTRALAVLTAPAPLQGWCPAGPFPLAAAVPGYEAVSGWDFARGGPKPNRFLVPEGSVYYFVLARELPESGSLAAAEDAAVGWGSYLEGRWNYAD